MTTTYRAVHATEGVFSLAERELTAPGPGEVRISIEACGVCHSDVVGVDNLFHHHPVGTPIVPGHEVVGRVDALGDGVTTWTVGQRVGVGYFGGHCGVCDSCRRGEFVYCTDQQILGDSIDGGYAEYVTTRATGLVAVPEEFEAVDAAPLLCAGVTVYNALRKSNLWPGDLVAIQGIGGLGHLAIQYAAKLNLRVVAIARGEEKRELALKLGATEYIDSSAVDQAAALQALGGAKVIIPTASSGASMTPLIDGLARGGQLMVVGATMDPIEIPTVKLIFGDKSVAGSLTGTPLENEENLAFSLAHGVRPMVETVALEEAADAYARMMSGAARFRMVLQLKN